MGSSFRSASDASRFAPVVVVSLPAIFRGASFPRKKAFSLTTASAFGFPMPDRRVYLPSVDAGRLGRGAVVVFVRLRAAAAAAWSVFKGECSSFALPPSRRGRGGLFQPWPSIRLGWLLASDSELARTRGIRLSN